MENMFPNVYIVIIAVIVLALILFAKRRVQLGKCTNQPSLVTIGESKLECLHCRGDAFVKREGILVTTWIALFFAPFWNRSARCFTCVKCGFVHWFVKSEDTIEAHPSEAEVFPEPN